MKLYIIRHGETSWNKEKSCSRDIGACNYFHDAAQIKAKSTHRERLKESKQTGETWSVSVLSNVASL